MSASHKLRPLARLAEWRQRSTAFRQGAQQDHTLAQRIANRLVRWIGSTPYLVFHGIVALLWLVINFNLLPNISTDHTLFRALTLLPTLETLPLILVVLMSRNSAARLADLRNELSLQLNVLLEEKLRKTLQLLTLIGAQQDIKEIINDPELKLMQLSIDLAAIAQQLDREAKSPDAAPLVLPASPWTKH